MHQVPFQFLCTTRVDDDPAGAGAALAGGTDRAKGDGRHGQFHVCVFIHDDGVIAPQFQQGTPHALCDPMADLATDRAGTGKRHQRNPRVVDEVIRQRVIAVYESLKNGRITLFTQHPIADVLYGNRAQWRFW